MRASAWEAIISGSVAPLKSISTNDKEIQEARYKSLSAA